MSAAGLTGKIAQVRSLSSILSSRGRGCADQFIQIEFISLSIEGPAPCDRSSARAGGCSR